jgi:hypothetical protein
MPDVIKKYCRYYSIAGITVQVISDIPIEDHTFRNAIGLFESNTPGDEIVFLHHHFYLPNLSELQLDREYYRRPPWVIYRNTDSWVYLVNTTREDLPELHRVAIFNRNYTNGHIYNPDEKIYLRGDLNSLTLFPTDQIILANLLADRQACYLHSSGITINEQGFLFVGHSGAGKSTIVSLLKDEGEILCDDRMILRHWPDGFHIHGTWSHGEYHKISPVSAPLRAILFLEQARVNELIPVIDRRQIVRKLPFFVIKPLATQEWWNQTLDLIGMIAREVPVYRFRFNLNGQVMEAMKDLL